ncbi:MAG: TolC family protein [Planctomycetaceae bacterium]|jgi:outer membrane protein TolC|nr:TolC family protein [Planctomycetaceae bacterium]
MKTRTIITTLIILAFPPLTAMAAETLESAWMVATSGSNRLRAGVNQIEAAKGIHQTAKAARLPVIANQTAYIALSEQPKFSIDIPQLPLPLPIPASIDLPLADQNFMLSSTTVTVPIYTGGKISAAIDAGKYQVASVQSTYTAMQKQLKLEVANAFFSVLRARKLYEVAIGNERSLAAHEDVVGKMLTQNIVTRNVFLAAQVAHATATQEVMRLRNVALTAEANYNRLLNRPLDTPLYLVEQEVPPLSGNYETLTAEALQNRRELNAIAQQSQAIGSQVKVANADCLPQIVAVGSFNYMQNSHLSNETNWAGGLGMKWTLFDGGSSRSRKYTANHQAAAASRTYDELRSMIELEVYAAALNEQETRSRITVAKQAVIQADENRRVVGKQFFEGLVNHTEVLDAQTQQTGARTAYWNAIYDAIMATYNVKYATGMM